MHTQKRTMLLVNTIGGIAVLLLLGGLYFAVLEMPEPFYFLWDDNASFFLPSYVYNHDTVIGEGTVVGGSVWLTTSVPRYTRVTIDSPSLQLHQKPPTQLGEGI